MDGWLGGAQWLPDSSGFYFQALVGDPASFRQQMLFHSISDGTQSVVELPQQDPEGHEYVLITMSPDGRFSSSLPRLCWNHDLSRYWILSNRIWDGNSLSLRPVQLSVMWWGNQLIAVTNHAASRGRVVSIPLEVGAGRDTQCWTEPYP